MTTGGHSRTSDLLPGTVPSAQSALRRHDSLLSKLLQYARLRRLSRAVTLVALGATVGVAGASYRVPRRGRIRWWHSSGQRAVALVRRHARAGLGIVAALAAAHVAAAASVRGGAYYAATQSSTCVSLCIFELCLCIFKSGMFACHWNSVYYFYFVDFCLIFFDTYMYRCLPRLCGTRRSCSQSSTRIFSFRVCSPELDCDDCF